MYNPLIYNNEVFKDIILDGIKPIYVISNYGTILNKITGRQISFHYTDDGYPRVTLYTIDNNAKGFLVHRLVMMTFCPIDNPELMEVNHIHGKKDTPYIEELEWATSKENSRHAFATGLNNNIRENHTNAVFTNEQVHTICKGLSEGKSFEDIEKDIGYTTCKDIGRSILSILERKAWVSISKDYIFKEYPNKRNSFNETEVVQICTMLESGYGYRDILVSLGIDIDGMSSDELNNYCNIISNIRIGKYYSNISSSFNMTNTDRNRYDQKLSNDKINLICQLLESGFSYDEILQKNKYN